MLKHHPGGILNLFFKRENCELHVKYGIPHFKNEQMFRVTHRTGKRLCCVHGISLEGFRASTVCI